MRGLRRRASLAMAVSVVSIAIAQERYNHDPPKAEGIGATLFRTQQLIEEHSRRKKYLESLRPLEQSNPADVNGAVSVLGRWAWGPCKTVELTGHYALVGQGFVYQVFDVSNPSSPAVVYDTTLGMPVEHIEIRDSTLFIVLSRTVLLCDASSLYPLVERGKLDAAAGYLLDMAVSDSLLFLMADFAGVLAYSIADLGNPRFLLQYGWAGEYGESAIASKGPYVYYAPLGPGEFLHLLNYVPDSSSFRTSGLGVGGIPLAVKVYDTLLVTSGGSGDVSLFNITDPWDPQLLGSVRSESPIWAIARRGQRLYCSTSDSVIIIIDITVVSHPVIIARYKASHSVLGSLVLRDSLLATTGPGLGLYMLSSADQITDLFYYPTGGYAYSIQMRATIGFIGAGAAGLWTVDLSDPLRPRAIHNLGTKYAYQLALTRNLACYLTSPLPPVPTQLIVAQASDSGSLSLLSATDFGFDYGLSITATDSIAFVAFTDSVVAYRIINPLSPQRLWGWTLHNHAANEVRVAGHYLYVAQRGGSDNGGLWILDISKPDTPQVTANLLKNVYSVYATDSLVLASADTGLCVIDGTNPSEPSILGVASVYASMPIARDGSFAYLCPNNVVEVFDISNPSRPVIVGSATGIPTEQIQDMVGWGKNILVSSPTTGLWILGNNLVTGIKETRDRLSNYRLYQNFPNPFNSSTVIQYSIPSSGFVSLRVYDLMGREVANLVNGWKVAGSYSLRWTPPTLASGVYFYRLRVGEATMTRKMVNIK